MSSFHTYPSLRLNITTHPKTRSRKVCQFLTSLLLDWSCDGRWRTGPSPLGVVLGPRKTYGNPGFRKGQGRRQREVPLSGRTHPLFGGGRVCVV